MVLNTVCDQVLAIKQNTCLTCFQTKYGEWRTKVYQKQIWDVDELRECSWRMVVARSACHQLCHQTVMLSTKAMLESKRWTFQAQTVNNWCVLGYHWTKHMRPKDSAICTSVCTCHVLTHSLDCCSDLIFTVQQLSLSVVCVLNLQLHGYSCHKLQLNWFGSVWDTLHVWDTLENKRRRFLWTQCI